MKDAEYWKSIINRLVTWFTRPKNTAYLIGSLFLTTGFGFGGVISLIEQASISGWITLNIPPIPDSIQYILWGIGCIGAVILLIQVFLTWKSKKKTIAIEHIGLKKRIATSLSSAIPNADTIPIDLTVCYENDKVVNPQKALELTKYGIEETLKAKTAEIGNKEVTIVYGGMPPVSLCFLAGYLMPNTYHVEVWDYNRNAKDGKNWYKVEGYVDSNKPIINWEHYTPNTEVYLLMSISYPVKLVQIQTSFATISSYIEVTMPENKYDNMSSIEKLTEFEMQFGELLKKLAAEGTEKLHIFCAAQSSFNFCMGRQVTRNHSSIIVYEYDISHSYKYPWGVLFNTKDDTSPKIIFTDKQ